MPKRAIPQVPSVPNLPSLEEPPQLDSPEEVKPFKELDDGDIPLGDRPDKKRQLEDKPFESPYMHHLRQDPSRQRREDGEQKREILKLQKIKRELDEKIREIRNQDTRINPYNMNQFAAEVADQMISDLRNMEQAPWSGNLSGSREYTPLHVLFRDQFSVSEEDEND